VKRAQKRTPVITLNIQGTEDARFLAAALKVRAATLDAEAEHVEFSTQWPAQWRTRVSGVLRAYATAIDLRVAEYTERQLRDIIQ